MAKLYFRYSTMNAGKSLEILKIANNYQKLGKRVMVFTPSTDNRYGVGKVTSRVGISMDAYVVAPTTDIYEVVVNNEQPISCVLVDEAQFLSKLNVVSLTKVVDNLNIPVICYGLKNDFKNELFEGSKWLLVYADKLEEVKTICSECGRKATMILKFENGKPINQGEQIDIGGNEKYKSVCRKHYFEAFKGSENNELQNNRIQWHEIGDLSYITKYAEGFKKSKIY